MSEKIIRISKKLLAKKLEGEWVFLHLGKGEYYGLNETGSLIWDECVARKDFEAVLEGLKNKFEVEPAQLEKDLTQFLKDLEQEGLLSVEGSGPKI